MASDPPRCARFFSGAGGSEAASGAMHADLPPKNAPGFTGCMFGGPVHAAVGKQQQRSDHYCAKACCVHMGSRHPLYLVVFQAFSHVQMIPSERDLH
jgi:hypothetical protein